MSDSQPSERLLRSFGDLGRALDRLGEAVALRPDLSVVVDGTIQRFEFCIELMWRVLQRCLETEGFVARSPKQVMQKAYAAEWIHNEALWIAMIDDRNNTSHTYKEELAQQIYGRIKDYYPEMRRLYRFLLDQYGSSA
jgi:nucleotidyltransferase substrate binding protein (TIGR01987 family)